MQFRETAIPGAWLVDLDRIEDHRGAFARTFDAAEFTARGLHGDVVQCNLAVTHRAGTVRGLHYQVPPAAEAKLIRCTRGAVHDVIVDMRPGSPTRLAHVGVTLTADQGTALYVPELFAHGYQALTDDVEVVYQTTAPFRPDHERGIRPDDPSLGVVWPRPVTGLSDKDRAWPLLRPRPAAAAAGPAVLIGPPRR